MFYFYVDFLTGKWDVAMDETIFNFERNGRGMVVGFTFTVCTQGGETVFLFAFLREFFLSQIVITFPNFISPLCNN